MSILFADFIIGVLQVSHQYTETGTSISETVPQSSQVSLFVSLKQFLPNSKTPPLQFLLPLII